MRSKGEAIERIGGGWDGDGVGAECLVEQVSDLSKVLRHGQCCCWLHGCNSERETLVLRHPLLHIGGNVSAFYMADSAFSR